MGFWLDLWLSGNGPPTNGSAQALGGAQLSRHKALVAGELATSPSHLLRPAVVGNYNAGKSFRSALSSSSGASEREWVASIVARDRQVESPHRNQSFGKPWRVDFSRVVQQGRGANGALGSIELFSATGHLHG